MPGTSTDEADRQPSPAAAEHITFLRVGSHWQFKGVPDAGKLNAEEVEEALTVAARFIRVGVRLHLAPGVLLDQLEQLAGALPVEADEPASSLSAHDEAVLREAGSLRHAMPPLAERASTRTAVRTAQLIAGALTVEQAGELLGVTPGRIRQRLSARTLFGVQTQGGWRLPAFQFTDAGALPGLNRVLRELPPDVHPLVVERFLHAAASELLVDDEPVSPAEWLASGGDIEHVAALAADLHHLP